MNINSALSLGLLEDIGEVDSMLTSDMSLDTVNKFQIAQSFWKKFQDEKSETADILCLEDFERSNLGCKDFSFKPESYFEELVIGEVKTLFDNYFFNGPDLTMKWSDVFDHGNVGPGSSIDVVSSNFYTKLFDSTLTSTSELLYRFYLYAIMSNPTWYAAEKLRDQKYGHSMVEGNRLSFVPKTKEKSRTVCTEPVLNMYVQKGIGSFLEKVLWKQFKIDLSKQPELNRKLARAGSIDGSFATIDLSCASDSISLELLEQILPPYFYEWLKISRSPHVVYPDGHVGQLYMVSSMGNGFTFPLQTLLFATIVMACYKVLGIKPEILKTGPVNFGIFGDDIIVRKDSYAFVIKALKLFGFTINDHKSFNCGHFRESCGGDYWKGHDVRGLYLKSLRTRADVYSILNRIIRWTARTGVFLPKVVSVLRSTLAYDLLCIPFQDGDTEGFKTPNPPVDSKVDPHTQGVIYYALCNVGRSLGLPDDVETKRFYRRGQREIFFNPDGLIVSLVGGYIRNGRIGIRSDVNRFKVRRRVTSSWRNYTAGDFHQESDWVVTFDLYTELG